MAQIAFIYHMTHFRNLQRIMQEGILSHVLSHRQKLNAADISSREVQSWRSRKKETVYGRSLHEYAPFYINPRNPMLYIRQYIQHSLVILCVTTAVLKKRQFVLADGNAASNQTSFSIHENVLDSCREVLTADDWNAFPEGKRKRCAEVLIYPKVEPEYIQKAICQNQMMADIARVITGKPASVDPSFFF